MSLELLVRTLRGMEWIASDEIAYTLPADRIRLAEREVRFRIAVPDHAVSRLATIDDAFILVGDLDDVGHTRDVLPTLARRVSALEFGRALDAVRQLRDLGDWPRFDVVASIDGGRNFNRYEIEDAVGLRLPPVLGGSYVSRSGEKTVPPTDLTVRLFLRGQTAAVAVRLGSHPLHRRAWKQRTGPGTLHPPVAAALAHLAHPVRGEILVDPFCGDGTIAIESALAGHGYVVRASDLDSTRLNNARANAELAKVRIEFTDADAARPPWSDGSVDAVVTNPPWNVKVDATGGLSDSLAPWWRHCVTMLSPRGRIALVADVDLDAGHHIRWYGFRELLAQRIRVAGRVATIMLYAPSTSSASVPTELMRWRRRAIAAGVVSDIKF